MNKIFKKICEIFRNIKYRLISPTAYRVLGLYRDVHKYPNLLDEVLIGYKDEIRQDLLNNPNIIQFTVIPDRLSHSNSTYLAKSDFIHKIKSEMNTVMEKLPTTEVYGSKFGSIIIAIIHEIKSTVESPANQFILYIKESTDKNYDLDEALNEIKLELDCYYYVAKLKLCNRYNSQMTIENYRRQVANKNNWLIENGKFIKDKIIPTEIRRLN